MEKREYYVPINLLFKTVFIFLKKVELKNIYISNCTFIHSTRMIYKKKSTTLPNLYLNIPIRNPTSAPNFFPSVIIYSVNIERPVHTQ